MDKLLLRPQAAGFSVTPPRGGVIRAELSGGAGRYSADIEGGSSYAKVNWITTEGGGEYLNAFYRNRTGEGSEPFLIDLPIDGSGIVEHTAYFMPETLQLTGFKGAARYYEADLEVLPLDVDEDLDSSVVDIYEAAEGDVDVWLAGFVAWTEHWPLYR